MINNFIATFIAKTYQIFRYYTQKLTRMYIDRAIIIKFVYHSREPATRIGQ